MNSFTDMLGAGHRPDYRHNLLPGQVFAMTPIMKSWLRIDTDVFVVIDDKHEVGFWSGNRMAIGDIAPGALVWAL